MENNPIITLIYLYNEWSSNKFYFFNFKRYIVNKIFEKIEDDFDNIGENNAPQCYYNNLKKSFK